MVKPLFQWEMLERVTVAGPDGSGRTRHRANPSMAQLRDGTLLVTYREGTDHWITPDGVVRLCRSHDGGRSWSQSETIVVGEGRSLSCHIGMRELDDGTLLLPLVELHRITGRPPYFNYYDRMLVSTHVTRSHDGGATWLPPRQIDLGSHITSMGCYGNVLIGREGAILLSVAWQQEGDSGLFRTGLLRSWDGGQSWGHLTQIAAGVDDEKSLCALPSGRLIAVMRDYDRPSKQSFSDDGGETWTPIQALSFHGQCPSLLQTSSGVLLCAYRQRGPGKPQGVGLAYSYDGGETWAETDPLYVSSLRDCAYPNLLEISPGEYIAVYYTAAMGTRYLVPQDDDKDPHTTSPELIKYADADNSIELIRFRAI